MRQGSEEEHIILPLWVTRVNPTGNPGKWHITILQVINPRVRQVGYLPPIPASHWCRAVLRVLTLTPAVCCVEGQHGLCGFGEHSQTDAEAGRWLALIGIVTREMAEFL